MMGTNRRNIALLFAAAFLQGMVFYSPVATLYRFSCGLSLTEVGLIESVSLGTMLALELPWGRWADALGHRRTIVLCSFLFALSKVVFWRAETFAGFLAERLLLAVCLSGLSGCDSAFLFLCCRGEEHRRVFARWEAVQTAGMLFSALCWPLMGGDYRRSAALTVLSYTAAALLTLALREPEGERAEEQRREPSPAPAALLRGTVPLIPFLLAFCLFDQTCQMGVVFLSRLQYRRAGIPEEAFGALSAVVTAAGLTGGLAHRLTRRRSPEECCAALAAAGCGACLLLGGTARPWTAGAAVALLQGLRSCAAPLALSVQNERVAPGGRAARLSCNAMVVDPGAMALQPAFGAAGDRGVEQGFLLGAACCAGAALFFLWESRRSRRTRKD